MFNYRTVSLLLDHLPLPWAWLCSLPATWPVLGFQGGHSIWWLPLSLYLHSRCSSLALLCFLTALYEFTPWTRGLLVPLEVGTLWTLVFLDPPSLTHTITLVTLLSQLSHSLSCPTAPSSLKESWTLLPMDLGRPVVGFQGGLACPLKGEAALHSHCSCSHGSQFSHYSLLSR